VKVKLPESISEITLDTDVGGYPYPPYGFYPFTECALGNGDYYGLYWPVGKEDHPPLVVEMWHDSWEIVPFYSSLESFLHHCSLAEEDDDEEDWLDTRPADPTIPTDPLSPSALLSEAQEALKANDPYKAIVSLEKALVVLPEYTAASALLYGQYRRVGDNESAIRTAMKSVLSPPSFGQKKVQVMRWLQAQELCPDDVAPDPLWINRCRLSGQYGGIKENEDYLVFNEVIQGYVQMGRTWDAIVLSMTYAELMHSETVSFRERYGFDIEQYHPNLRKLIRQLGGKSRDLI
jgi:hypothetical protein